MIVRLLLIINFLVHSCFFIHAEEGMWILSMIDEETMDSMKKLGLELEADDLYSTDKTSIKDAIVHFDNGCTGEIISENGLLLTNYHCGYGQIQSHSSLMNDYMQDGFWASSYEEELPNPGLTATFLKRVENVTDSVNYAVNDSMGEEQRAYEIDKVCERIIEYATNNTHYKANVHSFYEGNMFLLFIYEEFQDVRLVGAPPFSIGKFGAETDNWVWPRHSGDFCLFRVYAAPDGKPSAYSRENVPLKPRKYLPLSLDGYNEGDFAMTIGYAGQTNRYMTSFGIEHLMETQLPVSVSIRELRQKIMMNDMRSSKKVKIQYADKYYMQSSNGWKYYKGQLEELQQYATSKKREEIESRFMDWILLDSNRIKNYSGVLPGIEEIYGNTRELDYTLNYLLEGLYLGIEFVRFAINIHDILYIYKDPGNDEQKRKEAILKAFETSKDFYKNYNPPTDKKFTSNLLKLYFEKVRDANHPDIYDNIKRKHKNDFEEYADRLFKKSIFVNPEKFEKFLANPKFKNIENDPGYSLAHSIYKEFHRLYFERYQYKTELSKLRRLYIQGLLQMDSMLVRYPDANSTMRLSYGTIQGYSPVDAVFFKHQTTMDGIINKKDNNSWEYFVPDELINLYEQKKFGKYTRNKSMPVSFVSTNDITGGNSGSPVLNSKGHLIGVAYDGNWEAMSSDIMYIPEMQRSINVDIRYILFIIDQFAGASHLIDELHIIDN